MYLGREEMEMHTIDCAGEVWTLLEPTTPRKNTCRHTILIPLALPVTRNPSPETRPLPGILGDMRAFKHINFWIARSSPCMKMGSKPQNGPPNPMVCTPIFGRKRANGLRNLGAGQFCGGRRPGFEVEYVLHISRLSDCSFR